VPPRSQRERDADARQVKLDDVESQKACGSLTVRQMTDEERAEWSARPTPEPRTRRRPDPPRPRRFMRPL
jgi:hypothetical protein